MHSAAPAVPSAADNIHIPHWVFQESILTIPSGPTLTLKAGLDGGGFWWAWQSLTARNLSDVWTEIRKLDEPSVPEHIGEVQNLSQRLQVDLPTLPSLCCDFLNVCLCISLHSFFMTRGHRNPGKLLIFAHRTHCRVALLKPVTKKTFCSLCSFLRSLWPPL